MASNQGEPQLSVILQLPAKYLRNGEGRSQYDDTEGPWQSAIGLNPFLSDDNSRFLLATTAAPTRIGSSQITDIPIAYSDGIENPNLDQIYVLGSTGRLVSVNSSNTVSVIRPGVSVLGTLTNPTGAMAPVTDSGGNNYLFIALRQDLVRWDLNPADDASHWNVGNNSLSLSNHHPMHRFANYTYFGNGKYLGQIDHTLLHNQATTLSNINFQLLNFGTDQVVTAIGDDGRYTIIATSPEFDETGTSTAPARILWYPNQGSFWDWEVTLKGERAVRQIVRNSLGTFAIGEQTIYQLAFGAQPKLIRTFDTADSPGGAFNAIAQSAGPRVNCAAPFGDSLIFGKRGAVFGKRFPTEPVTFSHPLQGHTSDISLIAPDFVKSKVFVGTEDSKFWVYDMTTAGNTTNTYPTRWFDLKRPFSIEDFEIELPQGIGASDVLGVKIEVPSGDSYTLSLSQATIASKNRTNPRLPIKGTIVGSQVRFTFTPSAGAPKFGGINLYGRATRE